MNVFKRFLESFTSMAVMFFVMGSFGVFVGSSEMPVISYVGWAVITVAVIMVIREFLKLTKQEKNAIKNNVKHSVKNEAFRKLLGEKLSVSKSNKIKVVLVTIVHTLALVYAVGIMAFLDVKNGDTFGIQAIILLVVALFLGLLPIRHLWDYVEYYSHGFVYCGFSYLYQNVGGISFTGVNSNKELTAVWLRVNGDFMNGSYIKKVKYNYFGTYYYRAIDPLQTPKKAV